MFFYKKRHKKKKGNKGRCIDKSGCLKTKKRFGLTANEMDALILQMVSKPKIPIIKVT